MYYFLTLFGYVFVQLLGSTSHRYEERDASIRSVNESSAPLDFPFPVDLPLPVDSPQFSVDISVYQLCKATSSMCTMYRLFKKQLNFEDYVLYCNYRE